MLDVSASGLSAVIPTPLRLGREETVRITYGEQEYTGKVIVQSARELGEGRIRHGFHCVQTPRRSGDLHQGLQVISTSAQRMLIKRMARA